MDQSPSLEFSSFLPRQEILIYAVSLRAHKSPSLVSVSEINPIYDLPL
jgi:hypothetical protein